jgi:hypothetical protein
MRAFSMPIPKIAESDRKMRTGRIMPAWTMAAVILASIGCAGMQQKDIESQLIEAFKKERKTIQIKGDERGEVYTIDPLFKRSERGCELAVIRGWKDGIKIEEKEVEVCDNGDK